MIERAPTLPYSDRRRIATNLGVGSYFGPTSVEEALRTHQLALALVEDSLVARALMINARAALLAMQGRADEWEAEAERADRLFDELDVPTLRANLYQPRGEAARFLGYPERAEQVFRWCVELWDELGETGFNSTVTALLAQALCDLERFDEAEGYVERSRSLSAEDDFASQAAWRMAMTRVLSHRGEHDPALALADEAVAINGATDYLAWQAESDEVRGMVLAAAGRFDEARKAYGRALERFERKGVIPAVHRVRGRSAALEGE